MGLWDVIAGLVRDGTTLLLTTQYLEEADHLATRVAVIDAGRLVAQGTPEGLKARIGGTFVEVTLSVPSDAPAAVCALGPLAAGEARIDAASGRVVVPVTGGGPDVAPAVRRLDAAGIRIADLAVRRPTLDDVFLALTGGAGGTGAPDPVHDPSPGPGGSGPVAGGRG